MSEESPNQRLWSIDTTQDRDGVPMWPVFVILCIGALLIGVLSVPCIGLRMRYLMSDDNRMSIFRMNCTQGVGNHCLCTQQAGDNLGGSNCEVADDLNVKCQPKAIDYVRRDD